MCSEVVIMIFLTTLEGHIKLLYCTTRVVFLMALLHVLNEVTELQQTSGAQLIGSSEHFIGTLSVSSQLVSLVYKK